MSKEKQTTSQAASAPAKTTGTELAIPENVAASNWGAIEEMETTDLLVPKIYHMQAISKLVKEDKARPGDFCDSLSGNVLAKKDEKLEVIIFGSFKTMVIQQLDLFTKKFKLKQVVTITPENAREMASVPFTTVDAEGETFKNNLTYNFYVLIPSLIKELPFVLTMGGTKTKAARKINTMLYKLNQLKRPGASVVFELSSIVESKDGNDWFGIEITQGRNASAEELMRAYAWYEKSKSQKFVVVEEEAANSEAAVEHSDDVTY